MGHTKFENLKDLKSELSKISQLPGIKEKSPGIFYLKSVPFLHFHDKDGVRWADIKHKNLWKKIDINFSSTKNERTEFLRVVLEIYELAQKC